MKAVGVGCFWFASRQAEDNSFRWDNFDLKKHLSHIKIALEVIDNISNVSVDYQEPLAILAVSAEDYLIDNHNYFPIFVSVTVKFELYMPERIQKQYGLRRTIPNGVDRFAIRISYGLEMPVAYVSYDIAPSSDDIDATLSQISFDGSSAVVFIRKYLEAKLKDDANIRFQILGPSPFHADFVLSQNRSQKSLTAIKDLTADGRGYGCFFWTNQGQDRDLVDAFASELQDFFGTFYMIARFRDQAIGKAWDTISHCRRLFAKRKGTSILRSLLVRRQTSALIDATYEALLDSKMLRIQLDEYVEDRRRKAPDPKAWATSYTPLAKFIDNDLAAFPVVPNQEVSHILRIFEDRRQRTYTNLTAIAAVLIGAIAGALLTLILGSHAKVEGTNAGGASAPHMIAPTTTLGP